MSISAIKAQDYNPDILNTLANLSSDEVFTPPEVANQVLDLLPQELFRSPDTTFLDPATKSGVFLREIARRLMEGLQDVFPDEQERRDHIFHHQLFGVAITELTSLMSRRSLYCSKFPNGRYSVSKFENAEGNIRFKQNEHRFVSGRCVYCGASESQFGKNVRKGLEYHAYEFIHTIKPEEILGMKFDVIIGNPPYQFDVGVQKDKYAVNIFQKFVLHAVKLNPQFISMIIPDRWMTGGRGLNEFREYMMSSRKISKLVDYVHSADIFHGIDLSGGICYFLWDNHFNGDCDYTSVFNNNEVKANRDLNEFPIFVRYNEALSIIKKVGAYNDDDKMPDHISPQTPFGLISTFEGKTTKQTGDLVVHTSRGKRYISRSEIKKGSHLVDKYKVMFTKASPGGGSADSQGQRLVFSSLQVIGPGEVCTQTYLLSGPYDNQLEAENVLSYMKTKFFRFLLSQAMSSQDISRDKFHFVPFLSCKKKYTDSDLYKIFKGTSKN